MAAQRLLGCVASLSCCATAMAIGTTPPTWQPRQTIAPSIAGFIGHIGADRSLAYDHHGNPGVAFYDASSGALRFGEFLRGFGWATSIVDDPATADVGRYPSLAFDLYERPAISYHDLTNGDLKYAAWNGNAWQISTVDTSTTGSTGLYTSLAFDLYGRPAIAYYDLGNAILRFIRDVDGDGLADEAPVTITEVGAGGLLPTLAFDNLNRPIIAHFDDNALDLLFSIRGIGGWVTGIVDGGSVAGFGLSMAVNPDTGFPAIAYVHSGASQGLRYAEWNGSTWALIAVDPGDRRDPSLAFDPADGRPAISYFDFAASDLKLAWFNGSSWQSQIVDAAGTVGRTPSLAFNDFGDGFPSIAYLDAGAANSIYFIEDPPPVAGDVNHDWVVNVADLLAVVAAWGACPAKASCDADLNGDGSVNVADLLIVLANWG